MRSMYVRITGTRQQLISYRTYWTRQRDANGSCSRYYKETVNGFTLGNNPIGNKITIAAEAREQAPLLLVLFLFRIIQANSVRQYEERITCWVQHLNRIRIPYSHPFFVYLSDSAARRILDLIVMLPDVSLYLCNLPARGVFHPPF